MNRSALPLCAIVFSTLLAAAANPVLAASTYTVTPLQGDSSMPSAIGPTGTVAGMSFRLDSFTAVLWDSAGTARELVPGDVGESQTFDINAKGQVLLYHYGPYIWENGALTPVYINVSSAPLLGSMAFNDAAQVTGTGYFTVGTTNQRHAFLVSNGVTTDLGTLPGATSSWGTAINNSGDVTGYSYAPDNQSRAVLWRNGSIIDLGTLPGQGFSVADGINDHGKVVGSSGGRLFTWKDGVMADLGKYPGSTSVSAKAINNNGDIIGNISTAGSSITSPFVWNNGVFTDIGPVIQNGRGCSALSINDAGQIAMSCASGGAYLLSPTTPGSDLGVAVSANVSQPASVGSPLTYTIEVSNVGSLAATNVKLSDLLPTSVTFVSANTTQGSCSGTTAFTCSLGSLASGTKAVVQLTVIPNVAGVLGHNVSVMGSEVESNTPNNSGSASVSVAAASTDLGVSMSGSASTVKRLANLTYTINVKNYGPGNGSGVTLTDALPSSMSLVSANSTQGSCSGITTVTCSLGAMVNGAVATVTIVVQPRSSGKYTNSARISSSSPDSNAANNSASVTTTVK